MTSKPDFEDIRLRVPTEHISAIIEAIGPLAAKYGVEFKPGLATYDITPKTTIVIDSTTGEDVTVVTQERIRQGDGGPYSKKLRSQTANALFQPVTLPDASLIGKDMERFFAFGEKTGWRREVFGLRVETAYELIHNFLPSQRVNNLGSLSRQFLHDFLQDIIEQPEI